MASSKCPFRKESIAEIIVGHPGNRILDQRIGPECIIAFINPGPLPTRHPDDQKQSGTKGRLQPRFPGNNQIRKPTRVLLIATKYMLFRRQDTSAVPASASGPMLARYWK